MDEDDEDEEDEFNVTLQTPFPVRQLHVPKEKASLTSTSSESLVSRSTILSTSDNGSDLRTRTNSVASTMQTSDDSSVAGRKRRLQIDEPVTARRRAGIKPRSLASKPVSVKLPVRTRSTSGRQSRSTRGTYKCETSYEDSSESEKESHDSPTSDAKRRKLGAPSEDHDMRPTSRRADSDRTVRGVPREPQEMKAGAPARVQARKPLPASMDGRDVSMARKKGYGSSSSSFEPMNKQFMVPAAERRLQDPWR